MALTVLMALKKKNIKDAGLKKIKIDLTRELIKRKLNKVKHDKIMAFLAYYVNFEKQDMMRKFEEEVQQLTGRTTPMGVKEILLDRRERQGIEKGIEQGIKKGIEKTEARKNHDFVENLIKKMGLSDEQAADVAEVTIAFVKKVRKELEANK